MKGAHRRAAACFAVAARATTIAGERDAAINRGMAIIEGAGLDPDDFDIPGRTPTKPRAESDIRDKDRAEFYRDRADDHRATMAAFRRTMAEQVAVADEMRGMTAEQVLDALRSWKMENAIQPRREYGHD